MFIGTFVFALKLVCTAFAFALLLRAYLRYLCFPLNDRLNGLMSRATDWAITPASKFIPTIKNISYPSLFVCYLTAIVYKFFFWLVGDGTFGLYSIFVGSAVLVLYWAVELSIFMALAYCLSSWIGQGFSSYRILGMLTDPYLGIFRKYIPPYKNIDISAIVFFVIGSVISGVLWKFVG